ncbi:MAG: nucleotidyltransferase domain-containing protein [Oceanicaulis sp.]
MKPFAPPVSSLDDITQRLQRRAGQLRAFGVEGVTVFGSFATGAFDADSDVDLVVEPTPANFRRLLDLEDFLESCLMRRVDVVTAGAVKPALAAEIARVGRKIAL